jgi:hypothetical protein
MTKQHGTHSAARVGRRFDRYDVTLGCTQQGIQRKGANVGSSVDDDSVVRLNGVNLPIKYLPERRNIRNLPELERTGREINRKRQARRQAEVCGRESAPLLSSLATAEHLREVVKLRHGLQWSDHRDPSYNE